MEGSIFNSEAISISDDGTIVAGTSFSAENGMEVFRWTQTGGIRGLGHVESDALLSEAIMISADGSTIVGFSQSIIIPVSTDEAFRWTLESGMQGLGDLEGGRFSSDAKNVSADGSVVVGSGRSDSGIEAFRWTEASGLQGLGDLDGGRFRSVANNVSADGSVIVGNGWSGNGPEAFKWTEMDGMQGLGDLGGGEFASTASSMSEDGSVVVGYSRSEKGSEAFRWTELTGMQGLGHLGGETTASFANDVSADGSTVVGNSINEGRDGSEAFRWTEATGMQSIQEWLAESGVLVEEGFETAIAIGTSADGNTVFGNGTSSRGTEAWLARGSAGVITIEEFSQSFGTTASIQQTVQTLPSIIMNGRHHQVLMEQAFADGEHMAWTSGDFAHDSDNDANTLIGEVGIARDFGSNIRSGLGVGSGQLKQDLSYDGAQEVDGQYIMAEIDYLIPETSFILSLTGIYGDWDAAIERGYTNAGTPDRSVGDADVETLSARIRLDWIDAFKFCGFAFSSRAAYSIVNVETDGYTETGGGFPARFDSMSHTGYEIRLGLTGKNELTEKTAFRAIFEAVHRIDEKGDDFSGEVIGLFPFSINGEENDQTWTRIGAEISHRLRANMIVTGTLFGASDGEDPSLSAAVNLNISF